MKEYWRDTAVMKWNWNEDNCNNYKGCNKTGYHSLYGLSHLVIILCCCLAVIALVINHLIDDFPFTVDRQPNTHISNNSVKNTDYNTSLTSDTQSNANNTEWYLILVNKWNRIPNNYKVEFTKLTNGQLVDKRVYPALQEMFDSARNDGVYPIVVSGYRTDKQQQSLMEEKIAEYKANGNSAEVAISKAEVRVAIPGTSEHQLGIAIDINSDGIHSTNEDVYKWLNQNSYKYGFIHRYPAGKTEITGVVNEPWHYRYVGVDVAAKIFNQDICLEEYLSQLPPAY